MESGDEIFIFVRLGFGSETRASCDRTMSDLDEDISVVENSGSTAQPIRFKKLASGIKKAPSRKPRLDFDHEDDDVAGLRAAPKTGKIGSRAASSPVTTAGRGGLKQAYTRQQEDAEVGGGSAVEDHAATRTTHQEGSQEAEKFETPTQSDLRADPLTGAPSNGPAEGAQPGGHVAVPAKTHNFHSDHIELSHGDREAIEEGKNELLMTLDDAFVTDMPLELSGGHTHFTVDSDVYDLELGSHEAGDSVGDGASGPARSQRVAHEKAPDLQLQIDDLKQSIANLKVDQTQTEKEYSEVKARLDQVNEQKAQVSEELKEV